MERKRCKRCKTMYPATTDYFPPEKRNKDGLSGDCRVCRRAYNRKWHKQHAEEVHESMRRYAQEHPDKLRESRQRYKERNREKIRQADQLYREQNREKERARFRRHRQEHAEAERERLRRYYKEHPEESRQSRRLYKLNNPEKVREDGRRRRAKKNGACGNYTDEYLLSLYEMQKGLCCWCGNPIGNRFERTSRDIKTQNFTEDHIVPIGRGGSNYGHNIVLACWSCNCSHGARLVFSEWQPPKMLEWMADYVQDALRNEAKASAPQ